jgi:hypothetical protein
MIIGPNLGVSGCRVRFAMAKVEGSNPFIRFDQNPCSYGGFVVLGHAADEHYPVVGS